MMISRLQVAAESTENLATANHCLKIAAEEGRSLIGFLESTAEDQPFSFVESLEQFVDAIGPLAAAAQQEIVLSSCLEIPELPPQKSWSALRVLQQAVQNALQHAGPCSITISSQQLDNGWCSKIEDTGIGFDPNASVSPNHFGLSSMQQRANALGGRIDICSKPGQGTTIELFLPRAQ